MALKGERLRAMRGDKDTRVLIVEDEFLIGEELKMRLEKAGYTIAGYAGDGVEAVELTQELRPDVVIMDIKMPIMDGIQATHQIQSRLVWPRDI